MRPYPSRRHAHALPCPCSKLTGTAGARRQAAGTHVVHRIFLGSVPQGVGGGVVQDGAPQLAAEQAVDGLQAGTPRACVSDSERGAAAGAASASEPSGGGGLSALMCGAVHLRHQQSCMRLPGLSSGRVPRKPGGTQAGHLVCRAPSKQPGPWQRGTWGWQRGTRGACGPGPTVQLGP